MRNGHIRDVGASAKILAASSREAPSNTAAIANVPRCLIGIEAGMATHYVARELGALGHDVKQVPPLIPNRSGKATRTTSETPTRSRRLFSGRPHAAFQ